MTSIKLHNNLLPKTPNIKNIQGYVDAHAISYNNHLPVVINPVPFWITIVSQVAKIINNNSEKLRNKYINFENKKNLSIVKNNVFLDKYMLVSEFSDLIDENILDKDFKNWILLDDISNKEKTVLLMMMLGTFKNYFNYTCSDCGIPEIIIEGNVQDWKNIKSKLYKLLEFNVLGYDCNKWYEDLNILVDNCIKALNNNFDINYWKNYIIGYYPDGSGAKPYIKGHILCLNRFYESEDYYTKKIKLIENTEKYLNFDHITSEKVNFVINYNTEEYYFEAGNFIKSINNNNSIIIEPDYIFKKSIQTFL